MSDIVTLSGCNPGIADTSANFLSLPSELRNEIYELVLVYQEHVNPWADTWVVCNRQQELALGLLRASKVIHDEACSLFYGQNHFDFTNDDGKEAVSFLQKIGLKNASHIRNIVMRFPSFLYLDPGDINLEESSVSILESIKNVCTNLNTLTTSLESTDVMESRLDNLDNHKVASEALQLVDTHFRAIPSLPKIIVEVYEDGPNDIRKRMIYHGWTIRTTVCVEEADWGRSFSDFDDDYAYEHNYWSDDHEEYDIDNDSDFWRRAAD